MDKNTSTEKKDEKYSDQLTQDEAKFKAAIKARKQAFLTAAIDGLNVFFTLKLNRGVADGVYTETLMIGSKTLLSVKGTDFQVEDNSLEVYRVLLSPVLGRIKNYACETLEDDKAQELSSDAILEMFELMKSLRVKEGFTEETGYTHTVSIGAESNETILFRITGKNCEVENNLFSIIGDFLPIARNLTGTLAKNKFRHFSDKVAEFVKA